MVNELVVIGKDGNAVTDSLKVAAVFGKQHGHVLRDIQALDCSKEFNRSNFGLVHYKDAGDRTYPMVEMTRDGFTILVMGFTGQKATLVDCKGRLCCAGYPKQQRKLGIALDEQEHLKFRTPAGEQRCKIVDEYGL